MRFLVVSFIFFSFSTMAIDIVKFGKPRMHNDPRMPYKYEILEQALIATQDTYGAYKIEQTVPYRVPQRAILDIQSGKEINLFMAITKPELEAKSLAIKIPLKRGVMNYRLLTINQNNQTDFARIENIEQLKMKLAGLRQGWTTSDIFRKQQFNFFEVSTLDGLFPMLASGRIDYIPLAVNDIADDLLLRKEKFTELAVEKTIALYIKSPFYIFVSPKEPILAKRIEEGLERMIADGTYKKIFYRHFGDKLKKAELNQRKVFVIENPYLPQDTKLNRAELWFEFDEELAIKPK